MLHSVTLSSHPVQEPDFLFGREKGACNAGAGGGEGPNFDPTLWAVSEPFQADSTTIQGAGLQAIYFQQGGGGADP